MGESGFGPTKAYPDDAGYDLFVAVDTAFGFRETKDVPLGISVELPPGKWALLTGRSSTARRRGLLVTPGIIDNGYRGPLFVSVRNIAHDSVRVQRGERIAQMILFSNEHYSVVRATELSSSQRGDRAFGSTGL
jgi:dUTP pyrophosphatase